MTPLEDPKWEAFASRVADLLAERLIETLGEVLVREPLLQEPAADQSAAPQMVDAAELAAELGVSRKWIYRHADELGATRLTEGARPRLRFPSGQSRAIAGNPRQSRRGADPHSCSSGERDA